jgi:hypothetical protein
MEHWLQIPKENLERSARMPQTWIMDDGLELFFRSE